MATGYDNFSFDNRTLRQCKKHNRYQRCSFWESKSLDKLLNAIIQGYVPVGAALRGLKVNKPDE